MSNLSIDLFQQMFPSLRNTLTRNRIINGGGDPKPLSFFSHLTSQNPSFPLHIKVISSSSSSSFVVSYLMNSCGLTEKQALAASKKLNFKTTSNPDSVLTLFQHHGFTKPDISKLITKVPLILSSDTHKTLKPKLDYFTSKHIPRLELIKVLSSNPEILTRSLEEKIIPFFDFLKTIVGTDLKVFAILRRSRFPVQAIEKVRANIEVSRAGGVPRSNIVRFLINQPRPFMMETQKFKDVVEEVKGMGFDPYKTAFLDAIQVLTGMTKSTWETKLDAYRKWGWSEEQIRFAFMLHPQCMRHSEKKISVTMDYLVNQMGVSSLLIARCPVMLNYSLEKRIMPRCSVYRSLVSKGLIDKDRIRITSLLCMSEELFLDKFVTEYGEEAPELMKLPTFLLRLCKGSGFGLSRHGELSFVLFQDLLREACIHDEVLLSTFLNWLFNTLSWPITEFSVSVREMQEKYQVIALQQRKYGIIFDLSCNLARLLEFCTREIPESFLSGSDMNLRRLTELIVFILNHITSAADTEFFDL